MQKVEQSAVAQELKLFQSWWTDQLIALVPEKWKHSGPAIGSEILCDNQGFTVLQRRQDEKLEWRFDDHLTALDDEGWEQIAEMAAAGPITFVHCSKLLWLDFALPESAAAYADAAIALLLESEIPLKTEAVSSGYNFRRNSETKQLDVCAAVARNTDLDAIDALFIDRGLMPPSHVARDVDGGDYRLRSPIILDQGRDPIWRAAWVALVAAIFAVPFITTLIANTLADSHREEAQNLAQQLEPRLEQIAANRQYSQSAMLLQPVTKVTAVTHIVETLAGQMPSSMWIEAIGMGSDDSLDMVVVAANADEAAAILDQISEISITSIEPMAVDSSDASSENSDVRMSVQGVWGE